jgi:hypothetical protein
VALTADLDANAAILVRRILDFIAHGPAMIVVAQTIQISALRRQTDAATEQALVGDASERAELVVQLEGWAGQAAQRLGALWQELAEHLRALAARLRVVG